MKLCHVRGRHAQATTDARPVGLPRPALFFHTGCPLLRPSSLSSLNYFASMWAAIENILLAATAEGLACALHIPIEQEAEYVKQEVGSPKDYEFPCFLAIGYPAPDAHICKQKEIRVEDRIHRERW